MNKRQKTVMSMLKPKVKAYGFSRNVLRSVAAYIADKLDVEEDASDEDANAEIEKQIEAVLPMLPFIQSQANSQFDEWRKARKNTNDEEEEEDDDDASESDSRSRKSPKSKKEKTSDEEPAWFRAYRENMERQLADLRGERLADSRKARLDKLLKDTGRFGERTLRSYARMSFKDDEAFEEFLSEVEEDLKSENQDRANKGLAKLGAPATGGSVRKDTKPEVLPDADVKALASM